MGWILAGLLWGASPAAAAPPDEVSIPFEKYTLDNGLQVILSPDHSIPFVQVNLWYNVGSKDESAGRSGFAHLFEHLMFQGSQHLDDDYFVPLQRIGAVINGTTNFDRTNYFEGVPSEYLPLALWMESDRMGWLLPALTQEKLDNQKEVVRNERRQRYEIAPYGEVRVWLYEALYPEGHPYHIPTIGRHEDIEAATLEDVSAFFQTWYTPNNATLAVVGDFDTDEAKQLVAAAFADIPRGPATSPAAAAAVSLDQEVVLRREDDVPLHKVWVAWHSPASYAPGDADMDVLASLLSDGKDSRLYRALVREKQVARDITAYQASATLGSVFVINGTAADGHTTDEVVAAIDEVLATLRASAPTDEEVAVAAVNLEVDFFKRLQGIGEKANLLNMYNLRMGDPGWISKDIARYRAVTATTAAEAARTWLLPDRRVVLHVSPTSAPEEAR